MVELSIIGAGGLTGRELIKLLNYHPKFKLVHITSNQLNGKKFQECYPQDKFKKEMNFHSHTDPIPKDSTVVLATPNEVSMEMAPRLLKQGHKVIDLSGSFRLHDKGLFEKYYKFTHAEFDLMEKVVFGIPEIYRNELKLSNFVANPGCYATGSLLPIRLLSDIHNKISGSIIIDAKSGVSGAGGRTEDIGFSFTNTAENFRAYKILAHQHEPEIQEYATANQKKIDIVFTPHLLPVYRGILATIYIQTDSETAKKIPEILKTKCESEIFLRYYNSPEEIEIKNVQNTNYLDMSAKVRDGMVVIVSALDNLLKGAAGQALQNLNLMHGFEEDLGLL
ncbi:N-acetyl-gamma-glutamyl-phosphate reductase [Leptospira sp. GIMC2001]|uniref:N-acetyl-gamma-glutamyl-phosphate reductase n=1 Tax=Leptospira sp. GIMC2001 TaxID=1513297 RepID=UPI00234B039E|nr:N-acetyl-gamma-glutamyl-phosphate reductase [Leptospira sp. GIMC2001]WCL50969.1 N-acetyl-gamma-glutamyl-phosphate reductase [Leptospira sp. GIMC2001]